MAEIELKLTAPPDRLQALREALAAMSGGGHPAPVHLNATYYDTRGRDLARHGLTLRVRRENDRFVQTVKSAGRTLIKRGEWSDAIADSTPDLKAKTTGRRLRHVLHGPVRAQFKVDVTRTAFIIHASGDTVIEAAVDEGVIKAPGKGAAHDRVTEIELELKSGDPAALFTTALKLMAVAPLTIETRSKSARGYALLEGKTPAWVQITPLVVDASMTLDDVLRKSGVSYLSQCLRNTPAVLADSVEGIHQMRVALRRLRGLLNALKKELPNEAYTWANGQLKRILQALGAARNWDVFVDEMIVAVAEDGKFSNASPFLRAANIARMRAHLQARDAVASPAHTTAILELMRWFEMRGWRSHGKAGKGLNRRIGTCAGELVDRQFRRARKRGKGFAKLPTEQRHAFRIAVKSLRYTLDLLCPVMDEKKVKALIRRLKPLQETLGHLNDISTAEQLLLELAAQDSSRGVALLGGVVLGWHEGRMGAREKPLCRAVEKFRSYKPFW